MPTHVAHREVSYLPFLRLVVALLVQKLFDCQDAKKCRTTGGLARIKTVYDCFVPERSGFPVMPCSIGYARCSTTHQDTAAQVAELRGAGCLEVFSEKVSSRAPLEKRPQLRRCLETLLEGDELVVSKLDRLGRSQVEVINRLSDLQTKGIYVRTLDGLINTRSFGKLAPVVIGLITGISEIERSLIQERTRESVEHRRRTGGNLGGRPKTSEKKEGLVVRLRREGESYRSIRDQTGISLATIQRILKEKVFE